MLRKERLAWLPEWLRRWFNKYNQDGLSVTVGAMPHPFAGGQWLSDGETHLSTISGRNFMEIQAAERGFVSEDKKYWVFIGYYREDEPGFPEKGRAVCASLGFANNGR